MDTSVIIKDTSVAFLKPATVKNGIDNKAPKPGGNGILNLANPSARAILPALATKSINSESAAIVIPNGIIIVIAAIVAKFKTKPMVIFKTTINIKNFVATNANNLLKKS